MTSVGLSHLSLLIDRYENSMLVSFLAVLEDSKLTGIANYFHVVGVNVSP